MKKYYSAPAFETEIFETADVITASLMTFVNNTGVAEESMPEVNVLQKHFRD